MPFTNRKYTRLNIDYNFTCSNIMLPYINRYHNINITIFIKVLNYKQHIYKF